MVNNKKNILVFITSSFPYGNKESIFISQELPYLAKSFDEINIIPLNSHENLSEYFNGQGEKIKVFEKLAVSAESKRNSPSNVLKTFLQFLKIILLSQNRAGYIKNFRYFFSLLRNNRSIALELYKHLVDHQIIDCNLTFYTYWFEEGATIFSLICKKMKVQKYISRAHRFDLYEYASKFGFIPFRDFQFKYLEVVYCVSKEGQKYLMEHYPLYKEKIKIDYLGSTRRDEVKIEQEKTIDNNNELLIVSCSSIIDIKRVELIPEILKKINKKTTWIHFGDGPGMLSLKEACNDLPSNIIVELKGNTINSNILKFYSENKVDLFVHVSESEGIPVSMMEAISFGIPIFATNVGGVPEIVNIITGKLYSSNPNEFIPQMVNDINNKVFTKFNRVAIFDFWKNTFNAKINFSNFSKVLSGL